MDLMPENTEQPNVIIIKQSKWPLFKFIPVILLVLIAVALSFISTRYLPKPVPKITIPCPSIPSFCQSAQPVVKNQKYLAIGAKLASGSALYAVFDGKLIKRTVILDIGLGGGKFTQISLTNKAGDKTAVYYLNTKANVSAEVKKGQQIATTQTETIFFYDNYSLAFTLLDKNHQTIPIERLVFER